jgi:HTH-type transcriptional regulator, transcriptional repressor of NAD biosynthesis genes
VSRLDFAHALIVGKFHPPHHGHEYLIRTALFHCRRVSVLVLASSGERLPMHLRARWLRECFPAADHLRVIEALDDVRIDYDDPDVWRAHVDVMRGALRSEAASRGEPEEPVDVVFSSESYGDELARHFDARHVCLDRARVLFPVSGTAVRADLAAHWMGLPPPVRAGLALRVVVVGAESTGTTTLARALTAALRARGGVWERTEWVAEYGREYSANLLAVARASDPRATPLEIAWHESDFVHIAAEQTRREDEAARHGGPVLVCDTDALATCVWHERYRGGGSAAVDAVAAAMPPRALYLLTDHREVAFEDDGLRDGEHIRPWMTDRFAQVLRAGRVPWKPVTGAPEERLAAALRHVDDVMPAWWAFAHA